MSESDLNRLCKESYYDFSTQDVHETQLDAWKRKRESVEALAETHRGK